MASIPTHIFCRPFPLALPKGPGALDLLPEQEEKKKKKKKRHKEFVGRGRRRVSERVEEKLLLGEAAAGIDLPISVSLSPLLLPLLFLSGFGQRGGGEERPTLNGDQKKTPAR